MTTTTITAATPTKIKATGRWGARVQAAASEGDLVRITTKSGKEWDARVTRVWWTGDDRYGDGQMSICSTESRDRPARSRRARGPYDYCGYPCPVTGRPCTSHDPCHDCL